MQLLVGLGNPGARYAGNRHNVGFMAVQEIAKRRGFPRWRPKFHGLFSEGEIADVPTLLLLPGTFMNESGRAVAEAAQYHKLSLNRIAVFHDEVELHPAYVRVKIGGGNAGHNGLRSITEMVGNDYRRVGIGIGRPRPGETVEHYALRNFESSEQGWLTALLAIIAESVDLLVEGKGEFFEKRVRDGLIEEGFGEMFRHTSSRPKRTKNGGTAPTDG
jgi:peptidyl-tRNA hydrolase, PTH1 family